MNLIPIGLLFLVNVLGVVFVDSQLYLQTLQKYETLREATPAGSITRINNIDVVANNKNNNNNNNNNAAEEAEDGSNDEIGFCHIVDMNRYSIFYGPSRNAFPNQLVHGMLAAIALALEHLNSGNGIIVEEVEGLNERCNIRFTLETLDTAGLETQAVDNAINVLQRGEAKIDTCSSSNNSINSNNNNNNETAPGPPEQQQPPLPCAFFGAFRASVSIATGLLTSIKEYPQISVISHDPELDNKEIYSHFGQMMPGLNSEPLLDFLMGMLKIQHLAVVHTDDQLGISYVNNLRKIATLSFPGLVIKAVGYDQSTDDFALTVTTLKDLGYRYILAVSTDDQFKNLLTEAVKQGIAGIAEDGDTERNTHTWIVTRNYGISRNLYGPDDPLWKAYNGLVSIDTVRAYTGYGRYDAFEEHWQKLGESQDDIDYLKSKLPKYPSDVAYNPDINKETFTIGQFFGATAQMYDATIAVGLGACNINAAQTDSRSKYPDGPSHYESIINNTFTGVTGSVQWDPKTGSREGTSSFYEVINTVNSTNYTFRDTRTHFYDGSWSPVGNVSITFSDGTNRPHPDLPLQLTDYNYIGKTLRAVGLTLSFIVLASSIGLGVWTFRNSHIYIVRTSQPVFLYIICTGTALMGASIIPFSFDDEVIGENGASIACTSIPWLLSMGWCFAFSALFSKTKRVNKIFHNPGKFKRVKVEARDVIQVMSLLSFLNLTILIVWTIIDPLVWLRETTVYDKFDREIESKGSCSSDNFWAFTAPLIVINIGALCTSLHQAYIARHISMEFAESEWIFRAMVFILLVSFVGLPVFMFAESEPQAIYFVFCAIIFVICCSVLGFIFVPKILNRNSKLSIKSAVRQTKKTKDSQQPSNYASEASETTATSAGKGPRITHHPKLLQEELDSLRAQNIMLQTRLKENNPRISERHDENEISEVSESHHDVMHEEMKGELEQGDGSGDNESIPTSSNYVWLTKVGAQNELNREESR